MSACCLVRTTGQMYTCELMERGERADRIIGFLGVGVSALLCSCETPVDSPRAARTRFSSKIDFKIKSCFGFLEKTSVCFTPYRCPTRIVVPEHEELTLASSRPKESDAAEL